MNSLFKNNFDEAKPLALKMRPTDFEDFIGQEKLLGTKGILRKLIEKGKISNSIFYGPPGCGKTSLGFLISHKLDCNFESLNATTSGIADIKELALKAKKDLELYGKKTILFLDEIHRFNKLQQDSLLSYTEDGTLILIGATTENPYYNLNNALLSRSLIFEFFALTREDIEKILKNCIKKNNLSVEIDKKIFEAIVELAQGDARIGLNYLELYINTLADEEPEKVLEIFKERKLAFHKKEDKYNMISALIKSMRGSNPDAAIYWLARLLEGGEDPRYIARRIMIQASEDIGLANPEALLIANAAMQASERIGMPEIRIILAQAVVYLSISTKSNSVYKAINSAMEDIKKGKIQEVPKNICHDNVNYLYPHDYPKNFVQQKYMEEHRQYYLAGENKNEIMISEKLKQLWRKV